MNPMRPLCVAALALAMAACSARGAETHDPDMLVCAWIAGPDSFNPLTTVGSAGRMIEEEIFTPLVQIGADQLPKWDRSLAQKVDVSTDGKRYVLHLRSTKWSDGQPLTSRDVVFSILAGANPKVLINNAGDFSLMKSVRAVDPSTVELQLARPSPPFLVNALGETVPLPQHILGKFAPQSEAEANYLNTETAFSRHPVVSGPWRILRNVPDSYVILERNPAYWGPQPHLARIAFRVYPAQDSLYAAVDAGEVDVTDIPPNLWRIHNRLRGNYKAVNWPWNVTFYLLPNFANPNIPFLRDRTVRQAMMYAIDRRFIINGIMSGQADPLDGPVPRFSPYYDKAIRQYGYEPQRARQMLDAAGWHMEGNVRIKDGKPLRFTLKTGGATDAVASNIAELIQANLRAVGIDCVLQNEEIGTFFVDLNQSKFEVALRGRILNPYPDDYISFDSKQTRPLGGRNLGFYANSQADRYIEAARSAATPQQARENLNAWQQLAADDLPALFLYSNRLGAVVPHDLEGYELTPNAPAALPMGLEFWHRTQGH